jgi:hypothetical protein
MGVDVQTVGYFREAIGDSLPGRRLNIWLDDASAYLVDAGSEFAGYGAVGAKLFKVDHLFGVEHVERAAPFGVVATVGDFVLALGPGAPADRPVKVTVDGLPVRLVHKLIAGDGLAFEAEADPLGR